MYNYKLLILIIVYFTLTACSHMSQTQKTLFVCTSVSHLTDYAITKDKLQDGYEEKNPIYKNANNETMLIGKISYIFITYGIGKLFPKHQTLLYSIGCSSGVGLTIYNFNQ